MYIVKDEFIKKWKLVILFVYILFLLELLIGLILFVGLFIFLSDFVDKEWVCILNIKFIRIKLINIYINMDCYGLVM